MEEKERRIFDLLTSALRAACPYLSGNLSKSIYVVDDGGEKYIVIGDEDANYAAATNEPWVSPRWHGKKNPNEGWIDKCIQECFGQITAIYGGTMTEEEFNEIIAKNEAKYQEKRAKRIAQERERQKRI